MALVRFSRSMRDAALFAPSRAPRISGRLASRSLSVARSDGREPVLTETANYDEMVRAYQKKVPAKFNMGVSIVDKHVHAGRGKDLALIYSTEHSEKRITFDDLYSLSNRFANALRTKCGVKQGDRVAIYLPQCPETVICHAAIYKLGGIALPLFTLFGPDAVEYRLNNSEATVVVTDSNGMKTLTQLMGSKLPHIKHVISVDDSHSAAKPPAGCLDFYSVLNEGSAQFTPVDTNAEDPALIIYTSGTTANPKGCLHAHRVLLGHLPGVEMPQNFFPKEGDLFWTPADWAWIGGLLDVLLPSLYHRVPVLAHRSKKFDAEETIALMKKYNVRNTFMPPTALKLIRKSSQSKFALRSLGSGGETLGSEVLDWGKQTFGTTINEFYGQTECNLILSNCSPCFPVKPGSMGKPVPGKQVAIVDDQGNVLPTGAIGTVAVKKPDLTMFLRYWNMDKATKDKFRGDWMLTGDQGRVDSDGYYWFVGRDDDIITSGSYRIGPSEIEDCLIKHPKVALAAAVGKPDAIRTEIVKAFVVLREEFEHVSAKEKDAIAKDIQHYVKTKLAAHEYPREVEFVRELPMTTTGKVIRKALKQLEVDRAKGKQ